MRRNCEVRRIAACRQTYQSTIGRIAELIGILDDVQAVAVVIAAVHPVIDVIPPALDIAVLGIPVSIPVGRRGAGVVLHSIRLAVVLLGTAGGTAPADPLLTVPVRELH